MFISLNNFWYKYEVSIAIFLFLITEPFVINLLLSLFLSNILLSIKF